MQSLIYLTEEADAQLRSGNLAMALKKYDAIHRIFDVFEDDQFDFHGYSVRRGVLSVYTDMLKWADTLRSQPAYIAASVSAAEVRSWRPIRY